MRKPSVQLIDKDTSKRRQPERRLWIVDHQRHVDNLSGAKLRQNGKKATSKNVAKDSLYLHGLYYIAHTLSYISNTSHTFMILPSTSTRQVICNRVIRKLQKVAHALRAV